MEGIIGHVTAVHFPSINIMYNDLPTTKDKHRTVSSFILSDDLQRSVFQGIICMWTQKIIIQLKAKICLVGKTFFYFCKAKTKILVNKKETLHHIHVCSWNHNSQKQELLLVPDRFHNFIPLSNASNRTKRTISSLIHIYIISVESNHIQ